MHLLVMGCGSIGQRHIDNLQANFDVTITGFDVDKSRAEQVAEEFGIPTATTLEEAMGDDPTAVLVCTPPDTHLDLATRALDADAHVFIEKPLSNDLGGTQAFVERAEQSDKIVMGACNQRFHPPVRQLQEWLDEGALGEVRFVRLRYGNYLPNWRPTDYRESYSAKSEEGGGIILDGIHELDIGLWWSGDVETLYCADGTFSDLDIDVEDTAELVLRTEHNMTEIHLDYLRHERARSYEIIGSKGVATWEARGSDPERSTVELFRDGDRSKHEYESFLNEEYVAEMEVFIDCIKAGRQPDVDAHHSRRVLELALAAKRSAAAGEEVTVS